MSKSMAEVIAERKRLMEQKEKQASVKSINDEAEFEALKQKELKRRQESTQKRKEEKDQDLAAMKLEIDAIKEQLKELVSKPIKQVLKSPQEKYNELLVLYNLPLSISAKQLEKAVISNADHKLFLSRFTRVRKEINIYFSLL